MTTTVDRAWSSLPPLDGWQSSKRTRRLFAAVERVSRWLDVRIDGVERIPAGRALLVANHAFGWDVLFGMARVLHQRKHPAPADAPVGGNRP